MPIFGGGDNLITGREAQLPEYFSPMVGGAGPQFGDNNAQMPYMAMTAPAPFFDYRGPFGETAVVPEQWGDEGYVPYPQFAGPSGQVGLLPNLAFLYGQGAERIREGTSPALQPLESGINPQLAAAFGYMDNTVPALGAAAGGGLDAINTLLSGGQPMPYSGAVNYLSGLPAPIHARGQNPLYTAGLGALGGAGRMFPSMLDPATEGARRAALSGTVPIGTYQPILDDITRRADERQADLTRSFEEDIAPGLVQRLATGQANYGSAGERMAGRLARNYGEQQRRIEQDTLGQIGNIYSRAAQDALSRQYGAMGLGAQAAQNIFGLGGNILGQQTGLEQSTIGDALDLGLRASQIGMGTELDRYRIGIGGLPSMIGAAMSPLSTYMGAGLTLRDIENARLADEVRRDPLNASWENLQRFGGMLGLSPMPGPVHRGGSGTSALGGIGALLSGLGALAAPFSGGTSLALSGLGAGLDLANTGYPGAGGGSIF